MYTFGTAGAMDKIWLITAVIVHLFGAGALDKMIKIFIRRWSGGVFANTNSAAAGKRIGHGMVAGNPLRKKEPADEWYGKAKLLDPAAKYPMPQTPCGCIGEQSGHHDTLSCGHSCLGRLSLGKMPQKSKRAYETSILLLHRTWCPWPFQATRPQRHMNSASASCSDAYGRLTICSCQLFGDLRHMLFLLSNFHPIIMKAINTIRDGYLKTKTHGF